MRVVKCQSAGESYVNGSSGRVSGKYAAVSPDGEVVAVFRPSGPGSSRFSGLRDGSGRRLVAPDSVPVLTLAQFRAWVSDGLPGAFVRLPRR